MNDVVNIILMIPGMLIAFGMHEYAHAFMADRLGDKTPRMQGRLTLNPLAHIDPIGFIAVIVFKFGWAKPVETNPSAYKNYYKDDLKVSIAGPVMNFIVAIVLSIILGVYLGTINKVLSSGSAVVIARILMQAMIINVNIGLFNLIPIPGLDGFHVLRDAYPKVFYKYERKFYQYQMLFMVLLIFAGSKIMSIPANAIFNLLYKLVIAIAYIF